MDMSYNDTISEEDFALLLEDRAFVDYFNLYQSLPIFGQHVIYNFIEKEFSYEPPTKKEKNYIDRREVIRWLRTQRYPGFLKSHLFREYVFSSRLRDMEQYLQMKESDDSGDRTTFTRNLLGNAVGMQLFREFLIGTAGEKCYRCWLDLERIRHMQNENERRKLMLYIRNMYLADGAPDELDSAGKYTVFEGKLNFDFIPETHIQKELIQTFGRGNVIYRVNSDEAFRDLQNLIISAMKVYWVPRYILHLMKTAPKECLAVLQRETPHDRMAIEKQRQMKCRFMFPKVYESTDNTKPELTPTKVIESNVAGEMTSVQETPKFERSDTTTTITESSLSDTLTTTLSVESCLNIEEPTEEQEEVIKHSNFLTIAGGGPLEKRSPQLTASLDFGSADPRDLTSSLKIMSDQTETPPFTFIGSLPKIPPSLSTYISGTKRINTGRKAKSKVMIALAAEKLAGNPLQAYLYQSGKTRDIRLLEFWTDLRQYLDAEDSHRDEFGHLIKRKLANTICSQYLAAGRDNVLPETMKMTVFMSITREDDASLLCFVQDFATESLKDTVKQFMTAERKAFRRAVRRDHHLLGQISEFQEDMDKYQHSQTQGITPDVKANDSRAKSAHVSDNRLPSRASESSIPMSLTDEHIMKAFEFTVILAEYGRLGIFSYQTPVISNIVDVLYSDYGSLYIHKIPTTRHPLLSKLTNKPKIDIANIKVSRQVFLDGPCFRGRAENDKPRGIRRALRREGLAIERPAKPRTFAEVLHSQLHYDFFKRFMMGEKTLHPLAFWKSIEELRDMAAGRRRKIRIRNILRRNFSKKAKHGAFLDCNDDIMKQIPFMKKVPISVLECAQASVYRSMEMKWYPKYLETYPPDPGDEVPEIQGLGAEDLERIEEKPKKKKKQKTRFVSTIMGFLKSLREEDEVKLLHLFLKKQIQKALIRQLKQYQALFKDEADKAIVNPSNAKFEARILLKNRLVILDKLPSDLRFFGEVTKYVGQVDHIQSLENISQESMDFLNDKAREMVNCFLISDILPENQLNISEELAQTIISSLENEGATRGLFHDAFILIFPVLYHYWRQCQKKWLKHYTASELIGLIEKQNKMREKPTTPHKCTEVPDFLRLRESQMKIATKFMPGDEQFIINFSLRGGCKKFIPVPKVPAQNDKDRRASVMSRRTSMMGRRTSLLGRRTSLSMKQSSKSIRGSETIISDTSPLKEKEKEKEKSVSKSISMLMQKMHALAEEGSQGSKSPGSDKANFVDEIIEKSANTPSRLRKMNDLVSAAVQDEIDGAIFGDDNE